MHEVGRFVRDVSNLRGYRGRVARHALNFFRRYRRSLGAFPMATAMASAALICAPRLVTSPLPRRFRGDRRTYIGTTEFLDPQYTPIMRVAAAYEHHFRPTMVTGETGALADALAEDLGDDSAPTLVTPAAAAAAGAPAPDSVDHRPLLTT